MLTEQEKKEFDNKFVDGKGIIARNLNNEKYVIGKAEDVKNWISNLKSKWQREEREKIKSGKVCLSCGKDKEPGLADWCDNCLENN